MRFFTTCAALSWLAIFASLQTAHAESGFENVEQQILAEYGIKLNRYTFYPAMMDHKGAELAAKAYADFLQNFLAEARRVKLSKRSIPQNLGFMMVTDSNDDAMGSWEKGISTSSLYNYVLIDKKSPEKFVQFLAKEFPGQGTPEARAFEARNEATRQAIRDKIEALRSLKVDVLNCILSAKYCNSNLDPEEQIDYYSQERYLAGLIRLEAAVRKGKINTYNKLHITDVASRGLMLENNSFNYRGVFEWSPLGEAKITIERYLAEMEKLRQPGGASDTAVLGSRDTPAKAPGSDPAPGAENPGFFRAE